MMYQIKTNEFELITDRPQWVYRGKNGYFQHCDNQKDAIGIIVKGTPYAFINTINEMPEAFGIAQPIEVDSGELILNTQTTSSIMFTTMAEKGDIDDVTAMEHIDQFEAWQPNVNYKVGALRVYEGKLYRCVQAHTSQIDWTPSAAASLWAMAGNPGEEFPEWSQPVGAHDAYNEGDKVTHNGTKYVSTANGNVWEPGVYGWEIYTEE